MAILVTASLGMITVCWPYRLAQHWVHDAANKPAVGFLPPFQNYRSGAFPGALSPDNEVVVLEAGVRQLSTSKQRYGAAQLLLRRYPEHGERILRDTITAGEDPEMNEALLKMHLDFKNYMRDLMEMLRRPATTLPTTLYAEPREREVFLNPPGRQIHSPSLSRV